MTAVQKDRLIKLTMSRQGKKNFVLQRKTIHFLGDVLLGCLILTVGTIVQYLSINKQNNYVKRQMSLAMEKPVLLPVVQSIFHDSI